MQKWQFACLPPFTHNCEAKIKYIPWNQNYDKYTWLQKILYCVVEFRPVAAIKIEISKWVIEVGHFQYFAISIVDGNQR